MDPSKRNLIIFDDLMTEAKCDQRIADLFTKGSHHRNISIVYLTQNVFPQGRACRDIALNTQYLVLFNNPIDRQQVATLARRIYPSTCATFMRKFEDATARPYGYLVLDLKSSTSEQDSPYGKAVSLRISGEYAANNWRTALFAVIVRNIFTSYREYPANKTGQSKK